MTHKNTTSFIYLLLEKKAWTIGLIAVGAFILRYFLGMQDGKILENIGDGLEFASIVSASIIAVLLYFKDGINSLMVKQISEKTHTVVFGLGEFSSSLLEIDLQKNDKKNSYIVFEKNLQNEKIEYFKKSSIGVICGDALSTSSLDKLNFDTMEHAIIALGNDRLNIELATNIIDHYEKEKIKTPIELVVHIINQDLNILFHQQCISSATTESQIDIKTFSFYEEAAETFFEKNSIDGEDDSIIKSSEDYHIVVAGDGQLATNIIYQAAKIAHLPNENTLHVHLVDKEADRFKEKVIKKYTGIEKVVELHVHNLDDEKLSYFKDGIWFENNLTHAIVCYDDEERNLKITTDLFNKTYLADAVDGTLKTQVNFAMFNTHNISKKIDEDKENFKQFFSFSDIRKICTRENLLDEEHKLIAKLIHSGYAEKYDPKVSRDPKSKEVKEKWYDNSRYSDKLSSKAQGKHIDIKLKSLGLKKVKSNEKELLDKNRKILDDKLKADRESLGLSDEFLQEYSKELDKCYAGEEFGVKYFPKEYKTTLEKLIRAEHNRWNAFHYLNGWVYNEIKNKGKKEHDCLIPLDEFIKPDMQLTVIYDMYAILYIPNYLANAGYKIIDKTNLEEK